MSWSNKSKTSSAWGNDSKNTSTWDDGLAFLLQEIGAFLLQENGGKIVLQESWGGKNTPEWNNLIKN